MSISARKEFQRGQAFLIVVLVMVAALTIGLSIVSRTLTNVRLTTEEVNSQRAFSAAEAGVEQLLQLYGSNATQNGTLTNLSLDTQTNTKVSDASINPVTPQTVGGTYQLVINDGAPVAQDDGYDVWLTPFDIDPSLLYQNPWPGGSTTGNLSIFWGNSSANTCDPTPANNTMAAMEVIAIYGSRTAPLVSKYAFDPCASGRQASNHFSSVSGGSYTVGGKTFLYQATIPIVGGLIVRVIPVYASAVVGISTDYPLPAQGQVIVANGVSGAASQVKRRVTYFQGWDALPSEYYHALFVR